MATPRPKHSDPLVALFLDTDPEPEQLFAKLNTLGEQQETRIAPIRLLLEVTLGLRPPKQLEQIEVAYGEGYSVDFHLLFLVAWWRALFFTGQPLSQMQRLRDRMLALASRRTPPEIVAWVKQANGWTEFQSGNTVSFEASAKQLVDQISPRSPHYRRLAALRRLALLTLGKGTLCDKEESLDPLGETYDARLQAAALRNTALTGELDSLADLEGVLVRPWVSRLSMESSEHQSAYYTILLMAEQGGLVRRTVGTESSDSNEPAWVASTRYLLQNRREEALEWARIQLRSTATARRTVVGFDEYVLVRGELAAGNGHAAERLLRVREQQGSCHYVDDFFWLRADLLSGRQQRAAQRFARLMRNIETYNAQGRLNFELRLACELAPTALIELTRSASMDLGRRTSRRKGESSAGEGEMDERRRGVERLIRSSASMSIVCDRILSFAQHHAPVLVVGETGTGKELIARALHEESPHRDAPFVPVNCGALSDALVESELFGHERGAFTGAQTAYKGLFREVGAGTIFLDEIADITPKLQIALLRVLETQQVRPVGSSRQHKIECRIVAATNADLHQRIARGQFRRDLLFRLERLQILVPPLRERPDDVVTLAKHMLNRDRDEGQQTSMSPTLCLHLGAYHWPGNVRELRNVIERMRVLSSDKLSYDAGDLEAATVPAASGELAYEPRNVPHSTNASEPTSPGRSGRRAAARSADEADRVIREGSSPMRRQQRLRELFARFGNLKTNEVTQLLGVSRYTARRDLEQLCSEGVIVKVMPTASRRTQYYELCREATSRGS